MNIVHVVPALTKGGAERVAVELANHAVGSGHKVTLIAGWSVDPLLLRKFLKVEVSVIYISKGSTSKIGRYTKLVGWIWRQRSWLANQDIIHCHLTYGAIFGSVVKILCESKKPSVVETYHAVGMPIPSLNRSFHAFLASKRDALVLMAEDPYWQNFLKRNSNIFAKTIPNGISVSGNGYISEAQKASYRKELGIPDNCNFIIGSVGRMAPDRKPWLYLPIFSEIANVIGPEVQFILGGDGSELDQ